MRKAPFIALVGADGTGKSTLQPMLCEYFNAFGVREPGGTELAEKIRATVKDGSLWAQVPLSAKMLYFWTARVDLLLRSVRPQLEEGRMVIADRFDACTYAYQVKAEGKASPEMGTLFWAQREAYVVENDLEPDLYIWLDLDPEVGIARRTAAGAPLDFYDQKGPWFFQHIRVGYRDFFREAGAPYVCIDASGSVEDVFAEIVIEIEKLLVSS